MVGSSKLWAPHRRRPQPIRAPVVARMVRLALGESQVELAVAIATSYAFLFRIKSECVPLVRGPPGEKGVPMMAHSAVEFRPCGTMVVR